MKKELERLVSAVSAVSAEPHLEPARSDCARLDEIVSHSAGHTGDEPGLGILIDNDKRNNLNKTQIDSSHSARNGLEKRVLHLQKLLDYLEQEFSESRQKLADLSLDHDISFGLLWCVFGLGTAVTFKDIESGLICAGEVIVSNITSPV